MRGDLHSISYQDALFRRSIPNLTKGSYATASKTARETMLTLLKQRAPWIDWSVDDGQALAEAYKAAFGVAWDDEVAGRYIDQAVNKFLKQHRQKRKRLRRS